MPATTSRVIKRFRNDGSACIEVEAYDAEGNCEIRCFGRDLEADVWANGVALGLGVQVQAEELPAEPLPLPAE